MELIRTNSISKSKVVETVSEINFYLHSIHLKAKPPNSLNARCQCSQPITASLIFDMLELFDIFHFFKSIPINNKGGDLIINENRVLKISFTTRSVHRSSDRNLTMMYHFHLRLSQRRAFFKSFPNDMNTIRRSVLEMVNLHIAKQRITF